MTTRALRIAVTLAARSIRREPGVVVEVWPNGIGLNVKWDARDMEVMRLPSGQWSAVECTDGAKDGHFAYRASAIEAVRFVMKTVAPATAPVRVELPPVRVQGFDRLFKRLGEMLAPEGESR